MSRTINRGRFMVAVLGLGLLGFAGMELTTCASRPLLAGPSEQPSAVPTPSSADLPPKSKDCIVCQSLVTPIPTK